MVESDCVDDQNHFGFAILCDGELDKYDSEDVKDLTLSGVGESIREIDLNIGLIIILVIVVFVLSTILAMKMRGKKILK